MQKIRWFLVSSLALMIGYLVVEYLVQTPARLGLYGALLMLSIGGMFLTVLKNFKRKELHLIGLITIFSLFAGYSIANYVFLSQEEIRILPQINRTDGGNGHTAIIYFTHGEPAGYSALPWIETIRELDSDSVPFVPWLLRPIFFNTVRNEYFEAGGSAHNKLHQVYFENLKRSMPDEEVKGTKFYLAFLDSNPRPDEMAINAINDGASKIIILPVFITESTHTEAGKEMVASIHPEKYGIQVSYTGALWSSDSLQNVFVERANEMVVNINHSEVGILLVGHGQPTEWETLYPDQNKQEDQYRNAIREKLIMNGYKPEHVVLGWMEFQKPSITEIVHTLAERGVKKILVFAVSLSADSIHSDVEIPAAVLEAKLPDDVLIEYIGQYGDHPLAIQAMKEKITKIL